MGACCVSKENKPETFDNKSKEKQSAFEEWQMMTDTVGIGSAEVAGNYSFLKRHNFTHVVSIGTDFAEEFDDIEYLIFNDILDAPFQSLHEVLKKVIEFITEAENLKRKVFIHCLRGLSRSSALLFGYVMFKKRVSYDQAREIVQKKRPMANPNLGFELQLRTFEKANYDFAALDHLCWDREDVWIPHIEAYAPVILKKALLMEEKFERGVGNEVQNELMTVIFHFITIHNELEKMNAATRRTTEEFVKWVLKIQKYNQDENTYDRLTSMFNVTSGFENVPLRSLAEYEKEEAVTHETKLEHSPNIRNITNALDEELKQLTDVTNNVTKALDEEVEQLTEETPLIANSVPVGGTCEKKAGEVVQ